MKKLAIGCGLIALVLGAAVVGVTYYGYMKVRSTMSQFAELSKVPQIERDIRVKTPFAAPASRELTASQIERLVQVQAKIRERIGRDGAVFERNYKELANKKNTTVTDLPALLSAYRDLAAGWIDAKRAQVDALNEAGLSLAEYRWIRLESYRALGIPFMDIDFGELATNLQQQGGGERAAEKALTPLSGEPAPEANKKLVERFRKQLEDNVALASFGL